MADKQSQTAPDSEIDHVERVCDIGGGLSKDLAERLKEIDPELLILVARGNPYAATNLSAAQAEAALPSSILATIQSWNQSSWNNSFRDGGTWTNTWAQSPAIR